MLKKLIVMSILFLSVGLVHANNADVLKTWQMIDKGKVSTVEFYEQNGLVFGRIVKMLSAEGQPLNPVCSKCDGARKDQPVVGMTVIENMRLEGDKWRGGTLLHPRKGWILDLVMWVQDGALKVRASYGFIQRTQTWQLAS